MKRIFFKVFGLGFFLGLMSLSFVPGCGANSSNRVKVLSSTGGSLRHEFKVEIADDARERAMGLMYRKELGTDEGMLFIYPDEVDGPFWMQNTLIPLDIIFIGSDKKIVSIVANAEPQTTTPRYPEGHYQYVLEINGGLSEKFGIRAGDAISFTLP